MLRSEPRSIFWCITIYNYVINTFIYINPVMIWKIKMAYFSIFVRSYFLYLYYIKYSYLIQKFGHSYFLIFILYQVFISNTKIWTQLFFNIYIISSIHISKQGRTHKRCTLMDPHTWPCKSRTTSTNIHSAAMWGYGILSWRPA